MRSMRRVPAKRMNEDQASQYETVHAPYDGDGDKGVFYISHVAHALAKGQ